MKRRHFLFASVSAIFAGAAPSKAFASASPTPWLIPVPDGTLSADELGKARPAKGQVITCTNGHPFAEVVASTGFGDLSDWPALKPMQKKGDFTGMIFPLCCLKCGAVAIDIAGKSGEHTKWV